MIPGGVFLLCAATCLLCAFMLWRGYRRSGVRLLLWSSLCFGLLMLENLMLYIDMVVTGSDLDLSLERKIPGLAAVAVLLFGLIWEQE